MPYSPRIGPKQVLQGLLVIVLMIALAWLAFYALIVLLIVGMIGAAVFFVRRFLVSQGIIKPATPPDMDATSGDVRRDADAPDTPDAQVIEADYVDVTDKNGDGAPR